MRAIILAAFASVASASSVQEVVDNLFDKYLPQKATWQEVKLCHAKCNHGEDCLAACPKYECPFQRISAQCDLFNSSMAVAKACHHACRHDFGCHLKCPMAMPTTMKELKTIGEAMTCHTQCGHDKSCHKNCNCPWTEKQARCEKLKVVVTCMKEGGDHSTCPHLDDKIKAQLMQEPWSLAKDIGNHVADYLLPQEKEVSHEVVRACHMKCGWGDQECHNKCPLGLWKKFERECDSLDQASVCHHACEQSATKCPFKKTECHFKCPMSMPSSMVELKGLTDHVLCHTTCGQDKTCHDACPNSNWREKEAQCKKLQLMRACHAACGWDDSCHHNCHKESATVTTHAGAFPSQTPKAAAETARWMVSTGNWGYVTTLIKGLPAAQVHSFSDGADTSTGRLFFYIMGGEGDEWDASVTLSQAALQHTTSCEVAKIDPEDPRCAKLTISGKMTKVTGQAAEFGKAALFARHAQMKTWPASHNFTVYELVISDIWMIDFYGGGGAIKPKMYYAVKPKRNVPSWPPALQTFKDAVAPVHVVPIAPPSWQKAAQRARWLVYHSLWASVGTISVHLDSKPWGNVRSIADGVGKNSTGLPVFYLPTPDPTAVDIRANPSATLSFSEASLSERVTAKGLTCGGMDAEDPTCARLHLIGKLRPLMTKADIQQAQANLGARHPFAPWLAKGGAHTGGTYYTIDVSSLVFLDYYGGPAKLGVQDYLAASPEMHAHENSIIV